jgi:hypothetical protein
LLPLARGGAFDARSEAPLNALRVFERSVEFLKKEETDGTR